MPTSKRNIPIGIIVQGINKAFEFFRLEEIIREVIFFDNLNTEQITRQKYKQIKNFLSGVGGL